MGDKADRFVIFGAQTLPWACRIRKYGREVTVLGTKSQVDLATCPRQQGPGVAAFLTKSLKVTMTPIPSFLSLALASTGQIIHPGIMYGLFHLWDGQPYPAAPLFYQGIDAATADILQAMSDEIQAIRQVFVTRYPKLDLSAVRPLVDWLRRSYGDDIKDATSLRTCFMTNRGYAGLKAPMRPANGGLVPDFQARYLSEDVPYGLAATRGLAELAGVPTPVIDEVITWAQARLGAEYMQDGKLRGRDVCRTRAPQRYGYQVLDDFIEATAALQEET